MSLKKYLKGDMSEKELEDISEQLIEAKFNREKKNEWEQKLKNQYGVERVLEKKQYVFKYSKLAIAATITILLGIIAVYNLSTHSTSKYDLAINEAVENLVVINNKAIITRSNESLDTKLLEAITYYKDEEYNKSISVWNEIITSESITGAAYYNLALCYLQKSNSDPKIAIDYLLKARVLNGPHQEINWAVSIAYLKANQKNTAIKELRNIVVKKDYKYNEASEILTLLKNTSKNP